MSQLHPQRRNKVDFSSLTEEEKKLFRLYGKLPTHKDVLAKAQKDRKYFDSGDYALSKAGVTPQNTVGTAIPNPENIPHASSPHTNGHHQSLSTSPTHTSPVALTVMSEDDSADQEEEGPETTDQVTQASPQVKVVKEITPAPTDS